MDYGAWKFLLCNDNPTSLAHTDSWTILIARELRQLALPPSANPVARGVCASLVAMKMLAS